MYTKMNRRFNEITEDNKKRFPKHYRKFELKANFHKYECTKTSNFAQRTQWKQVLLKKQQQTKNSNLNLKLK